MVAEHGKEAFEMGDYNDLRRSQQISSRGLLRCEAWIEKLAGLDTGLKFKHSMLMVAVQYGIKHAPTLIPIG